MHRRYIYPFFEKEDIDEARDYLVECMLQGVSDDLKLDGDDIEAMRKICNTTVMGAYGTKNITNMANIKVRENVYLNSIAPYIIEYMALRGYKAESIVYNHPMFFSYYLQALSRRDDFTPLKSYWNPNEEWDVTKLFKDTSKNIMHPITHFQFAWLRLYGVSGDFATYMSKILKYSSTSKPAYETNKYDMIIQTLPSADHYANLKIKQCLEKFF